MGSYRKSLVVTFVGTHGGGTEGFWVLVTVRFRLLHTEGCTVVGTVLFTDHVRVLHTERVTVLSSVLFTGVVPVLGMDGGTVLVTGGVTRLGTVLDKVCFTHLQTGVFQVLFTSRGPFPFIDEYTVDPSSSTGRLLWDWGRVRDHWKKTPMETHVTWKNGGPKES